MLKTHHLKKINKNQYLLNNNYTTGTDQSTYNNGLRDRPKYADYQLKPAP